MKVRLRPGADAQVATQTLGRLAANAYGAIPAGTAPQTVQQQYVLWATRTEQEIQGFLRREDAAAIFGNPRHRDICSMQWGSQVGPLVHAEIDAKAKTFREMEEQLRALVGRMRNAPGVPVVPDSNILLECQRADSIAWSPVLGDSARVLLPLRVIEEIDDKKRSPSKRLAQAARDLLPWIESHFPEGDKGPVSIRSTATLEVVLAERPRYRPDDADEEVLDAAHEVKQMTGSRVVLLTTDTGMRLRGLTEGLEVLRPPAEWLRRPPSEEPVRASRRGDAE